jgi:hypothetical protein
MAGWVHSFVKLCIGACLLSAAGGIGYYYSIYLPPRDAPLETSGVRMAAEKSDAEVQQAAAREAAQAKYDNCIRTAENTYSSSYAEQCKRVQDKSASDLRDCLSLEMLTKASCEGMYGGRSSSSDCSLPSAIGSALSDQLDKSRKRCLDEGRAGLQ